VWYNLWGYFLNIARYIVVKIKFNLDSILFGAYFYTHTTHEDTDEKNNTVERGETKRHGRTF